MAIMEAVTLESELMATLRGSRSDTDADVASVEPGVGTGIGVDEKREGGRTDDSVFRRRPNMGK